jgi:hypothetical protein
MPEKIHPSLFIVDGLQGLNVPAIADHVPMPRPALASSTDAVMKRFARTGIPGATTLYMLAYTSTAQTIETLVHEWYHQAHDVYGQSAAAFQSNEAGAVAAGKAARNAYMADGVEKCGG